MTYPHQLLDDVKTLASYKGWGEEVYQDFFKLQRGEMSEAEFSDKYHHERAVLSMDMTGFTSSAMRRGELQSLLRIMDAQRVAIPVMQEFGAELIRCFADDIVALFLDPNTALEAAFETHRRIQLFNIVVHFKRVLLKILECIRVLLSNLTRKGGSHGALCANFGRL